MENVICQIISKPVHTFPPPNIQPDTNGLSLASAGSVNGGSHRSMHYAVPDSAHSVTSPFLPGPSREGHAPEMSSETGADHQPPRLLRQSQDESLTTPPTRMTKARTCELDS